MNNKLIIGLLIGIVIGAAGMYGINRYMLSQRRNMMMAQGGGRGGAGRGGAPMGSMAPQPTASASAEMVNGEKVFTISGSNFKFSPNYIAVNKGDKVKVVFNNTMGFHDFVVEGYDNVRTKQIQANSSDSVEFTADKTGTFDFYCSVGNHRAMGMQGTLVVQ